MSDATFHELVWREEWFGALKRAAKSREATRECRDTPSVRQRCGDAAPWQWCEDAGAVVTVSRCVCDDREWVGICGLIRCKSAAECPYCARSIAAERAELVERAVRRFEQDTGGVVYLCSVTVRHTRWDDPRALRRAVTGLWRRVWSGKGAALLQRRIGIAGMIRAVDVTYGDHGAHPHLHVLLFCEGELGAGRPSRTEVEQMIFDRWSRFCAAVGVGEPTRQRGVLITRSHAAAYITRMGLSNEVAKGLYKRAKGGNVTHWQALVLYLRHSDAYRRDRGDERERERAAYYASIWDTHVRAMRGTRWLWWTPGAARWRFERERERAAREELHTFGWGEWQGMSTSQRAWVKIAARSGFYDEPPVEGAQHAAP